MTTTNTVTLSTNVIELIESSALDFNGGEKALELGNAKLLKSVDSILLAMGLEPSFDHACAVRDAWKAEYLADTGYVQNAADKAWSRLMDKAEDLKSFAFPTSKKKEAVKKAEQRTDKKKAVEAAIESVGGDYAKLEAAAVKAMKDDPTTAQVYMDAAKQVYKEKQTAAKKEADAKKGEMVKQAHAELKEADIATVQKVLDLLAKAKASAAVKPTPIAKANAVKHDAATI